ncbi:MAG: GNAT family N-acetyltransferase [Saprospiraceae bacterium]|nr:GNAT family N-acetyltransferase [Saprospiraceae bacterium]
MPTRELTLRTSSNNTEASNFRFSMFRSIEAAGHDWDMAAPEHDLFLQRRFLSVMESHPPIGMRFAYLVFYGDNQPVGVALCQIKYFKADDNIQDGMEVPEKEPCFFTGLSRWVKRWVAGKVAADILICGNMLLTGEHGFYFNEAKIGKEKSVELLENALVTVVNVFEKEGVKMPVILVKDLTPEQRPVQGVDLVNHKGFVEFEIQPNMVLPLHYKDFDDYLQSMSTKYRTRAKRAFKRIEGIEKRELTQADIQRELPRLYHLYREIAHNAGFNMVDLNEHYLLALKQFMPEEFRMYAYYLNGELIAFYTTIQNGEELEAHFLGYDKVHNHEYQLYLNILYDIIRIGIDGGCHQIVFARTALEIKSSVGALPRDLYCYLRHQHVLANRFTGAMLDYFKPVEMWQQRHPFKGHALSE